MDSRPAPTRPQYVRWPLALEKWPLGCMFIALAASGPHLRIVTEDLWLAHWLGVDRRSVRRIRQRLLASGDLTRIGGYCKVTTPGEWSAWVRSDHIVNPNISGRTTLLHARMEKEFVGKKLTQREMAARMGVSLRTLERAVREVREKL